VGPSSSIGGTPTDHGARVGSVYEGNEADELEVRIGERFELLRSFASAAATLDDDGDVAVAVAPDHPFLITGPDLMVGRRGRLVAAFLPTAPEQAVPGRVLDRVAISRLALPPATVTVLLDDGPATVRRRHFDAVLPFAAIDDFAGFCASESRSTDVVDAEVRQQVGDRYSAIADGTRDSVGPYLQREKSGEVDGSAPRVPIRERDAGPGPSAASRSSADSQGPRGATRLTSQPAWRPLVRRAVLRCVREDFELERGAPTIRGAGLLVHVLSLDQVDTRGRDPFKPFRSAAFAGLLLPSWLESDGAL